MLKWLWISLVVIVFDQLTKQLATDALILHEPVAILPYINLTLVHNAGAAFSFLSDASGWQRWFFIALALVVSVVILFWMRGLPGNAMRTAIPLALILGGALGNVWDRIQYGYVVDFIDVYYDQWHWPAFNVADSSITIGTILLIADALWGARHQHNKL
ncbi:MAG TPA: signal peptidase II [Gammaproteobacteria bacterium]